MKKWFSKKTKKEQPEQPDATITVTGNSIHTDFNEGVDQAEVMNKMIIGYLSYITANLSNEDAENYLDNMLKAVDANVKLFIAEQGEI